MGTSSITDELVLNTVKKWLEERGEIFVDSYLPHSGSSGFGFFVRSFSDFSELVSKAPSGAVFTIFREQRYPIRGKVDDILMEKAMQEIKNGEWYGIVGLDFYPEGLSYYGSGNSHTELKKELEELRGMSICVGKEPNLPNEYWNIEESNDVIVASKP